MARVAIVLAGGDAVDRTVRALVPADAYVIAADSGLAVAETLGLPVDLVVGDMDSVAPGALAAAEAAGAVVERHPAEKDATDLELALVAARRHGAERVVLIGGAGGRVDHFLANVAILAASRFSDLDIEAYIGDATLRVVRAGDGPVPIGGMPGDLVSLLPVGDDAGGIITKGLEYPLRDAALELGTTRGVSNVIVAPDASVALTHGVLLVVRPGGAS